MHAIDILPLADVSAHSESARAQLKLRPYLAADAYALRDLVAQLDWSSASQRSFQKQSSRPDSTPVIPTGSAVPMDSSKVWVVTRQSDGQAVGCLGLVISKIHHSAQLHLSIGAAHARQGYGREAAALFLDLARELGLERISAEVIPSNLGARKILQKVGMQLEGRLRGHRVDAGQRVDVLYYGILLPGQAQQ